MSSAVAVSEMQQPFYEEVGRSIALARGTVNGDRLSECAGISRRTLTKIEKGDPSVAFGSYCAVARVLGLEWLFDLIRVPPEPRSLV